MNQRHHHDENRRGVGTYLLIGAFVFVGGIAMLLIIGALLIPRAIDRAIEEYTVAQITVVEPPNYSDEEYAELEARVEGFGERLERGEADTPLILTEDELNVLAYEQMAEIFGVSDDGRPMGSVHVRIEDGTIRADASLGLDELARGLFSGLEGRYLQGEADFDVDVAGDSLRIYLEDFRVKGDSIPSQALVELQRSIDEELDRSPEARNFAEKIDAIEVHGDSIILRPAPQSP